MTPDELTSVPASAATAFAKDVSDPCTQHGFDRGRHAPVRGESTRYSRRKLSYEVKRVNLHLVTVRHARSGRATCRSACRSSAAASPNPGSPSQTSRHGSARLIHRTRYTGRLRPELGASKSRPGTRTIRPASLTHCTACVKAPIVVKPLHPMKIPL